VSNGERARFEVILESIETKIGVLADGHLALHEKFDRLEGKVDRLSDDVALLRTDLGSVKNRVEKIDRVGRIEHRVGKIEHRVGKIEHHVGLNGVSKARTVKRAAAKPVRKPR